MAFLDRKEALFELRVPWLGHTQPAETYTQLLDSLLSLDQAVNEVLGRVEARVARERQTLRGLEQRIAAAAARARRVADSNTAATVVFSAARYPAPKQPAPFERLFYDDGALDRRAAQDVEVPEEPPVENFAAMAERRRALDRIVRMDVQPTNGTNGVHGANGGSATVGPTYLSDYAADLALRPELAANKPTPSHLMSPPRRPQSCTIPDARCTPPPAAPSRAVARRRARPYAASTAAHRRRSPLNLCALNLGRSPSRHPLATRTLPPRPSTALAPHPPTARFPTSQLRRPHPPRQPLGRARPAQSLRDQSG
jgi:hypothetical protein